MTESIHMKGVCLRRNGRSILHDIDWTMLPGEHWAVIGGNGSGKTTLLKIAGGLLFPTAGEVNVLGCRFGRCDLQALRKRVGWVGPALLDRMPAADSLWEIVASGASGTLGKVYETAEGERARVDACLERAELTERARTDFGVLSQGERQRALFARSMLADPELYILDEACSGLDLPAREQFLSLAGEVMAEGRCGVVMVTHHIEEIPPGVTHALVLRQGRTLARGAVGDVLRPEVLSEAFGMNVRVDVSGGRYWARLA